jgi:hypothetical protein
MNRRIPRLVLALTTAPLVAAAPPPEGLETDIALGGERVAVLEGTASDDGETAWMYRYVGAVAHAQVRSRAKSGLTWGGQVDLMPAFVSSADALERIEAAEAYTPPRYERGDITLHGMAAARIGWHAANFGVEGGVALPGRPGLWDSPVWVQPTGMVWAGEPDIVYAWARYLYGPTSLSTPTAGPMAGLGHNSAKLRLIAGVDPNLGWLGEAAFEVSTGIKMGAQVARAYADQEEVSEADVRGLVRITVGHERVESQY